MLLPVCRFYGGMYLPRYAQNGKAVEIDLFLYVKIAYSLIQTYHTLLYYIFGIAAEYIIAARFYAHHFFVAVYQRFLCKHIARFYLLYEFAVLQRFIIFKNQLIFQFFTPLV